MVQITVAAFLPGLLASACFVQENRSMPKRKPRRAPSMPPDNMKSSSSPKSCG